MHEFPGKLAEVDVGTGRHSGCGDRHVIATFNQQRRPTFDDLAIRRELHLSKEMVGRHGLVAGFEKGNLFRAVNEADVRNLIHEVARTIDHSFIDRISPKLL